MNEEEMRLIRWFIKLSHTDKLSLYEGCERLGVQDDE